jgi:hypothetical protein
MARPQKQQFDLETSFFFGVRCESALQKPGRAPTAYSIDFCFLSEPTEDIGVCEGY